MTQTAAYETVYEDVEIRACPVESASRIVGQKWTLQIVHHLLDCRCKRFCELQEELGASTPAR
ncbi:MAG: hypothetical protein R2856_21505 [Caldilineaceae bacterium]